MYRIDVYSGDKLFLPEGYVNPVQKTRWDIVRGITHLVRTEDLEEGYFFMHNGSVCEHRKTYSEWRRIGKITKIRKKDARMYQPKWVLTDIENIQKENQLELF